MTRQFEQFSYEKISKKLKNIGLVVLKTDETIEDESRRYFANKDVSLLHTRIEVEDEINEESLLSMENQLQQSLSFFPQGKAFDVIAYACTSGATIIGEDVVDTTIKKYANTRFVTNPLTAVRAKLKALGIKRLVYLAPYISSVSDTMCDRLETDGISIVAAGTFSESLDSLVTQISSDSIIAAVKKLAKDKNADAVFIACTSLKTEQVIIDCEQALKIPVLTSCATMFWHIEQCINA